MRHPVVPQGQLGNRYRAFNITIPDNTTDYSICENNVVDFPDWNSDWDERDYWDICVIKNLDAEISIKFHAPEYNSMQLSPDDCPAIWEHFVYRDVYVTNLSGGDATFNIIFINNRTITPPPRKPINPVAEVISATSIKISFEDNTSRSESFNEDYFKIERSSVSAITGFVQIATQKTPSLMYSNKPITIKYSDNTCSSGTQYWYRIKSYSEEGGNSGYTDVVTGTTP